MKKAYLLAGLAAVLLALAGCPEPDDKTGKQEDSVLSMAIKDIPKDTKIFAATLFDDTFLTTKSPAQPVPLAAGMNFGGVFEFNAYDPSSPTQMGAPWTKTGQYYILLATSMDGSGKNYVYSTDGQSSAKYSFTTATASIAWDKFVLLGGENPISAAQLQLTVTGIPSGKAISAAMLFDDIDDISEESVPKAYSIGTGGVFKFVAYDDSSFPSLTGEAFTTAGQYYIILAAGGEGDEDAEIYIYTGGGQEPKKYNFTAVPATIAWGQFVEFDEEYPPPPPPPTQLELTVSGITGATIVAATLLTDGTNGWQPVAVGMNFSGNFKFLDYADMDSEFTTPGQYYVLLATNITGSGDNYVYISGTGPGKYSFTSAPVTLTWSQFVKQTAAPPPPPPTQLELTVTGITGTTIVAATLLVDGTNGWQPVAVGMNFSGNFKFLDYADMDSEFTTPGQYYVLLATNITGSGDNYVYISGTGPGKYSFTSAPVTLTWSQFVKQQQP